MLSNILREHGALVITLAKNIKHYVVDLFAPAFCRSCKAFLEKRVPLCNECLSRILPLISTIISVTPSCTVRVVALGFYDEPLSSLIMGKSWSDHTASRQLAQLVWSQTTLKQFTFDYLVPVPLHWQRYAKRGYNQAYEMAHVFSTQSGKPIADLVKRVKATPFQSSLPITMRTENVTDAFVLACKDKERYRDAHFMIVDDLMTTGATIRAVARELKKLHPASITAVVACRAL